MSRKENVENAFTERFGYQSSGIFHGPGRVNLIGDHTDYNDGFVLPAAINFGTDIAASLREDRRVRVLALDCNGESSEFSLDEIAFDQEKMWVNYVGGSLLALMKVYPDIRGVDMVISGNVPLGAGLSSSASLEIAILKTVAALNNLPLDGVKAALMGQDAENNFVGCNCGIMDQLISAMGKDGHAMLLDCRSLTFEDVPVPPDLEIVIINSNVKRGLVDSEYNTRRQQCETVAKTLEKPALRDLTIEDLEANKRQLDDVSYRRARHVITENDRARDTLGALIEKDTARLSTLMKASHESLRDDFEVTTKELDGLVSMIDEIIGESGGVRMTGGGFGGCVVALAPKEKVQQVFDVVSTEYPKQFGLTPDIYVCRTAPGAFRE
ncbi:galactokinase [Microbulbifer agarilyticus]|uniref:galactokinase n=1 Tax=Microbulbifer agarilyticus TaxID=260552 RepID=UPI001CD31433|nr:galactokinase [Microbulbifer agarilyticus]MCA0900783.1 galactokinase [Microbulbifer agarilyticus]